MRQLSAREGGPAFPRIDVEHLPAGYETCRSCQVLRLILANAIVEWREGCELAERSQ